MKKLLLVGLLFSSCTVRYMIQDDIPQLDEQAEDYILASGMSFPNNTERKIITKSLYYIFGYIRQKFGEQQFQKFYLSALHGTPLPEAARVTFGQTFYGMLSEAYFSLAPVKQSGSEQMNVTNIGVFKVHYFPESAAEKDLPMIFYLLDNYFTAITNILVDSPQALANLKTNLSLMSDKSFQIFLYEERSQTGSKSIADGYIGYTLEANKQLIVPEIGLKTAYYNIFSSYVFSHELTHLLMGLTRFKTPLAPIVIPVPMQISGNAMTDELYRYVMPIISSNFQNVEYALGNGWGEGIAEYVTSQCNLYFKYGLLDDVDNDLKYFMQKGGSLTPLPYLLDNGLWAGINQAMTRVHYQEMHSAVKFVAENHGWKKLIELINSPGGDADFLSLFELSKQQFGEAWLASLKAE
ncbi:MAG: hypothetical protein A2Y33_15130 [Spirochaetes bacterium GWF1_51_8]|nr:MAG: hypothetical protein A2Y33_15130 [Spirochaetes bacterium GWF1_51_8]